MVLRRNYGFSDQEMKQPMQQMPTLSAIREAHGWKRGYEQYLPLSRYLFRPVGFWLTWAAIRMGWTSEGVSWLSCLVGFAGCALLVSGSSQLLPAGIGLLFLFNLLDCVDGSIARTLKTQNPYGRFLDSVCGGVIDLAFWAIVGIMAFQQPQLLHWPQPWGHGPVFWLAVGGVTCFLCIFLGYVERTFDELLREHWDRQPQQGLAASPGESIAPVGVQSASGGGNQEPEAAWLRAIVTNMRVRETHYGLFLIAYWAEMVDLLLGGYLLFYCASSIFLLAVYVHRGRQILRTSRGVQA